MKLIILSALAALGYNNIVPTVTIQRDGKAVRINEGDYDPETMELFDAVDAPEPVVTPEPAPQPEPSEPVQLLVMKSGGKFFITDNMGTKVEGDEAKELGINDTGYTTEAKAQTALAAITKQA